MKCEGNQHYGITGEKTCQCGEHELSTDETYKEYSAFRYKGKKEWYIEVKPKENWDEDKTLN